MNQHSTEAASAWTGTGLLLAGVLGVAWIGYYTLPELQSSILVALTNLILAIALHTFAGNSGVLSFGHIGFAAIGAYTYAVLATPQATKEILLPEMPQRFLSMHASPLVAVLTAGALAGLIALVFGAGILRLSGLGASIATFAMLLIVNVVASNWTALTGGVAGTGGVPMRNSIVELSCWVAGATVIAYAFHRSRIGLLLRSSREDESAARSIGISIFRERMAAWLLSAFIAGVAGALIAQVLGSFAPSSFFVSLTFLVLAMVVVGGITSLSGTLIGVLMISVALELLRHVEQNGIGALGLHVDGRPGVTESGLAFILLVCLMLRPQGITQGRELIAPRMRWPKRASRSVQTSPSK